MRHKPSLIRRKNSVYKIIIRPALDTYYSLADAGHDNFRIDILRDLCGVEGLDVSGKSRDRASRNGAEDRFLLPYLIAEVV